MNKERIKEVFSDQEFIKELVSLEAAEDIQALLKTKGFELDLEQRYFVHTILCRWK